MTHIAYIPQAKAITPQEIDKLKIYRLSKRLVIATYSISHDLPAEEKSNLMHYIRSSALTAHICIIKGLFKKQKKKARHFSKAQSALLILETAVSILLELGYANSEESGEIYALTKELKQLLQIRIA